MAAKPPHTWLPENEFTLVSGNAKALHSIAQRKRGSIEISVRIACGLVYQRSRGIREHDLRDARQPGRSRGYRSDAQNVP
jgi:hypothetical protein